ncbi:MAG: hypothetical protein Q4F15_02485 [Bacillota bacterium]|nr:hypothetical protein [Bacillota bacterium]
MKLRKRNKDISNTSSEIKLGKGKRHRLSHPAFILVLAIVSCIGVGFSSWNVGNTSAFVEIDATVGKLVTGTVVADCFVSASVNADFSVCDQGLDVAGEVVDSADLVYEIGFNAAEASDNNLLTSSTDGSVFSFTIDFRVTTREY